MATAAFNTIAEIQRLRDAGFEQSQAEAITLSIHAGVTGGVATKEDVERVDAKIDSVEERLNTKIDASVEVLQQNIKALDTKIDTSIEAVQKDIKALDSKIDSSVKALDTKIDSSVKALDTKIDSSVKALDTKIDNSVDGLRATLETKIERAKFDLTWRLLGGVALINGLIFALLRYMPPG